MHVRTSCRQKRGKRTRREGAAAAQEVLQHGHGHRALDVPPAARKLKGQDAVGQAARLELAPVAAHVLRRGLLQGGGRWDGGWLERPARGGLQSSSTAFACSSERGRPLSLRSAQLLPLQRALSTLSAVQASHGSAHTIPHPRTATPAGQAHPGPDPRCVPRSAPRPPGPHLHLSPGRGRHQRLCELDQLRVLHAGCGGHAWRSLSQGALSSKLPAALVSLRRAACAAPPCCACASFLSLLPHVPALLRPAARARERSPPASTMRGAV